MSKLAGSATSVLRERLPEWHRRTARVARHSGARCAARVAQYSAQSIGDDALAVQGVGVGAGVEEEDGDGWVPIVGG